MPRNPTAPGVQVPERIARPGAQKTTARGRGKQAHVDERSRETRAQEESSNELFERVPEDKQWERPASLEAPKERAGFKQRWIRIGYANNIDEKNLARKLKEGWRARHMDTVPKSFHIPRTKHGRFAGCIIVEGMLLCEMPERLARQRAAKMRAEIDMRTKAVDDELRRNNAGSVSGGFGPIKKAERTKAVREVSTAAVKEAEREDVEL